MCRRAYLDENTKTLHFGLIFMELAKMTASGIKRVNHMIMLGMDTLLCECGDNDERFYFALQFPGNITYSLRAAGHCDCFAIHL